MSPGIPTRPPFGCVPPKELTLTPILIPEVPVKDMAPPEAATVLLDTEVFPPLALKIAPTTNLAVAFRNMAPPLPPLLPL